jgi:hypothetical protein
MLDEKTAYHHKSRNYQCDVAAALPFKFGLNDEVQIVALAPCLNYI